MSNFNGGLAFIGAGKVSRKFRFSNNKSAKGLAKKANFKNIHPYLVCFVGKLRLKSHGGSRFSHNNHIGRCLPSSITLIPLVPSSSSSSSSVISFHNIRRRRRWGKENNDINNNNWDWQTQSANGGQKFELENLAGTEGICPNLVIFEKHLTDLQ